MNALKIACLTLLATAGSALAQAPAADRIVPTVAPNGTVTATVDLGEIPQMKGYILTQTLSTVAPGTGRPMHSHAGAPEVVRILSGVLTESHNGGPPAAYGPGSTLVNAKGTQHMWANLGSDPVVFVATQIKPAT